MLWSDFIEKDKKNLKSVFLWNFGEVPTEKEN